jgi:hypothetical protein
MHSGWASLEAVDLRGDGEGGCCDCSLHCCWAQCDAHGCCSVLQVGREEAPALTAAWINSVPVTGCKRDKRPPTEANDTLRTASTSPPPHTRASCCRETAFRHGDVGVMYAHVWG